MSARFEKCEFHNNDAEDGAVLVEGGTVVFKQCQFKENLGVSVIAFVNFLSFWLKI